MTLCVHLLRTILASVLALYEILGYPSDHCPDVISWDKFTTRFGHERVATGRLINTRRLTFGLNATKQQILLEVRELWLTKKRMSLLEAGELLGHYGDAAQCNRWAHARFITLQNFINNLLRTRYHAVKASMDRRDREAGIIK